MRAVNIVFLLLLIITNVVSAQQIPALEREVSLTVQEESVDKVLTKIAALTGIKFSYSPSFIEVTQKVSIQVYRKPVRSVLYLIFGEHVRYKSKGNFIILTANPVRKEKKSEPEVVVSGYVYDANGAPVAFASLLNKREQLSTVTNKYGYYSIKMPVSKMPALIAVKKQDYKDTLVKMVQTKTQFDIVIEEIKKDTIVVMPMDSIKGVDTAIQVLITNQQQATDTTKSIKTVLRDLEKWLLSESTKANIRNISDTIFSGVQFSVIPGISTNKLLSGNTVNKVSVSLLVGYSKGIEIGAVASLANIVAGNARYGMAAGILNVVRDSMIGVEASGMFNLNGGYTQGAQLAGFGNVNRGNVNGLQASGYFNVVRGNLRGAQLSGFANLTSGNVKGAQMAGFVNAVEGEVEGTQVAGFVNTNKGNMYGTQISGFANVVHGDGKSVQLAGFGNFCSGELVGSQISGLFNYAKTMHGIQVGLINWSDSCTGIPIGLFSFSKKGYHKIEASFDEMRQTQLSFRLGVQKLHNLFNVGADLTNRLNGLWNFGYGVGSYHHISEHWRFGGELMAQLFLKGNQIGQSAQVNTLFIGFERQFGKRFSVGIGPAYRVLNQYSNSTEVSDVLKPYAFYTDNRVSMWAGGKLSIKFL